MAPTNKCWPEVTNPAPRCEQRGAAPLGAQGRLNPVMAGKIFINYRRDDSASHALAVAGYLENTFCKRNIFIDIVCLRADRGHREHARTRSLPPISIIQTSRRQSDCKSARHGN